MHPPEFNTFVLEWDLEELRCRPIRKHFDFLSLDSLRNNPVTHPFGQGRDQSRIPVREKLKPAQTSYQRTGSKQAKIYCSIGLQIRHMEDIWNAPSPCQNHRR